MKLIYHLTNSHTEEEDNPCFIHFFYYLCKRNMKLLLGMLVGSLAQVLTFLQLQGRWKFEWMRNNQWLVVLMGIPISILFMTSVSLMVQHFDGQLWPSRLIGFVIGTIMFTILSVTLFGEPITVKTGVCLLLSLMILMVQLFWK